MNRDEFISKLQSELQSVPADERENALKYYREYFDDAGVENEQQVISELESPEVIAQGIKMDLGYSKQTVKETVKETVRETTKENYSHQETGYKAQNGDSSKNGQTIANGNIKVGQHQFPVWAVILFAILLFPVIVPVASGLFGAGIGIVCGAIGIAIGFFAATLGLLIAGVATIVWGIASIIAGAFYTGILLIGLGLTLIGFGLLFLILAVQLVAVWIPQFIRWIVRTIKNGFNYSKVQKGVPA